MEQAQKIQIHDDGKIDVHDREAKYRRTLKRFEISDHPIERNKELILSFLRDCFLGKTSIGRTRRKIGSARCLKYLGILQHLSDKLGKSFDAVTEKDIERYVEALETDEIATVRGHPYSDESKADIKKTMRKFWKWKDGKGKVYPEMVEWLDTSVCHKEVPAISRNEIERMIQHCATLRDKAILIVLFDSGARAEEILNVRLKQEHVFWAKEINCYKIRLEYSKTKPRTISLPLSTRLLKEWLNVHPGREDSRAQLFPLTYAALKMVVSRVARRALDKRVTPHILRHSSATYYAPRIKNRYQLCYRYGWAMSSNMVDRYLDREGVLEEETPEAIEKDILSKASREKDRLGEELALLKESQERLEKGNQRLKAELDRLRDGKGILSLLAGLQEDKDPWIKEILAKGSEKRFDAILGKN